MLIGLATAIVNDYQEFYDFDTIVGQYDGLEMISYLETLADDGLYSEAELEPIVFGAMQ